MDTELVTEIKLLHQRVNYYYIFLECLIIIVLLILKSFFENKTEIVKV